MGDPRDLLSLSRSCDRSISPTGDVRLIRTEGRSQDRGGTMWRSGVTRRRSHAALLEMVQAAGRTGSFESPWHAAPQVWCFFRNEGEILCDLQRQWRTALAGEIYVAIERGEGDLRSDVARAFEKVERKHHAV